MSAATTKHALLGATGGTGSAILRHLLANPPPNTTLNIYVRNKAKLLQSFPNLEDTTTVSSSSSLAIQIYQGSSTDISLLKDCLRDVQVIHMCIATNVAKKGDSLFTDTASAVLAALQALQEEQEQQQQNTPTLIILRAVPLNPNFATSSLADRLIWFLLEHVYNNMIDANRLYEAAAHDHPGLLEYIYVDPPGIMDLDGTETTGYEMLLEPKEGMGRIISYADLGAAFCEIAVRRAELAGKGVVVVGTGKVKATWARNVSLLALNLRGRLLRW